MTTGRMRRLFSSSTRANLQLPSSISTCLTAPRLLGLKQYQRTITDVRARQASVSRTWFTASATSLHPESGGDHPPNERNVKLGNSKSSTIVVFIVRVLTGILSCTSSPRAPPDFASIPASARHSLTANQPSSVPLVAPASSDREGQDCLHSSIMDGSHGMGPRTRGRQCQAEDHVGAYD